MTIQNGCSTKNTTGSFVQGLFKCELGSIGALRKQVSFYSVISISLFIGNLQKVINQSQSLHRRRRGSLKWMRQAEAGPLFGCWIMWEKPWPSAAKPAAYSTKVKSVFISRLLHGPLTLPINNPSLLFILSTPSPWGEGGGGSTATSSPISFTCTQQTKKKIQIYLDAFSEGRRTQIKRQA